jgi:gluconate 2-dehydrogenase alpha chain
MADTKMKPVDVVVVGSGVVGSIMSMELANAGLKVLCLERGRMIDPQHDFVMPYVNDELKYDRHSDIFQNLSRETITIRNNGSQTALPMRELGSFKPGEMVGGTAAHWGCNARRFSRTTSNFAAKWKRVTARASFRKTAPARTGA